MAEEKIFKKIKNRIGLTRKSEKNCVNLPNHHKIS